MNIDKLLIKGALLIVAGSVAATVVKATKHYKEQKETHEEIMEDASDEK